MKVLNYNILAILGPDDIMQTVREVSIVDGSGDFRRARGYMQLKTVYVDFDTGDAEVEVDVYVYPYHKKM
jgi:Dirigent-like protein